MDQSRATLRRLAISLSQGAECNALISTYIGTIPGTSVGDVADIVLVFDDDYRGGPAHPMPPWFGDELDRNPAAQTGWANLPPSRQKEILRYFAGLKSQAAQERNVRQALHVLAGGTARFMARDWNADPGE